MQYPNSCDRYFDFNRIPDTLIVHAVVADKFVWAVLR